MKLVYSPTVSTLYNCSSEYVSRLTGFFSHDLDRDYLKSFEKIKGLPFTPAYSFKAELQPDDTYNVRIYSGFVKTILLDIYSGKAGISTKDFSIVSTRDKYEPSNLSISEKLYIHQRIKQLPNLPVKFINPFSDVNSLLFTEEK